MKAVFRTLLAVAAACVAMHATAQVSFFEREDFEGQAFTVDKSVEDLRNFGFVARPFSAVVTSGQWEFCDDTQYRGRCVLVRPGNYASWRAIGLRASVLSVRSMSRDPRVADPRQPPAPCRYQCPCPVLRRFG